MEHELPSSQESDKKLSAVRDLSAVLTSTYHAAECAPDNTDDMAVPVVIHTQDGVYWQIHRYVELPQDRPAYVRFMLERMFNKEFTQSVCIEVDPARGEVKQLVSVNGKSVEQYAGVSHLLGDTVLRLDVDECDVEQVDRMVEACKNAKLVGHKKALKLVALQDKPAKLD